MYIVLAFNFLRVLGGKLGQSDVVGPLVLVVRVVVEEISRDSADGQAVLVKHSVLQERVCFHQLQNDISDVEKEVFIEVQTLIPEVLSVVIVEKEEDILGILEVTDNLEALKVHQRTFVHDQAETLQSQVRINQGVLQGVNAIPEHYGRVVEAPLGVKQKELVCYTDEGTFCHVFDNG